MQLWRIWLIFAKILENFFKDLKWMIKLLKWRVFWLTFALRWKVLMIKWKVTSIKKKGDFLWFLRKWFKKGTFRTWVLWSIQWRIDKVILIRWQSISLTFKHVIYFWFVQYYFALHFSVLIQQIFSQLHKTCSCSFLLSFLLFILSKKKCSIFGF